MTLLISNWKLSNPSELKRLERAFAKRRIDHSIPGFCDSPEFLSEEQVNPRFLEMYARYVESREYSPDYLQNAAQQITIAANAVRSAVEIDGRQGACVDASGMLARMLDRLGIWNYVAKSTLTIEFPDASGFLPRYFWAIDEGNFIAPHAIVVAPPFGVIDVTLRYQAYSDNQQDLLPHMVLGSEFDLTPWNPDDIANSELQEYLKFHRYSFRTFMEERYSHMLEVMGSLPPRALVINDVKLKYVVVAVGGYSEVLEDITGYQPCGRTALQIFRDDVLPKIAEQGLHVGGRML